MTTTPVKEILTDRNPVWLDPELDPPPKGSMLEIVTVGGVVIQDMWRDNSGYVAYRAYPKLDPWIKARISAMYARPSDSIRRVHPYPISKKELHDKTP